MSESLPPQPHLSEQTSWPVSVDGPLRSPTKPSQKKTRKRLKDGEHGLAKELARYKETAKKAKDQLGGHVLLEDREKVKKAEWMYNSIRHYLDDDAKKSGKSVPRELDDNFHGSVDESIADLKTARKRIKALLTRS